MNEFLPVYDLTPFTMLDFPDRVACIVWFSGCNMRCLYCHNPEIVKGKSGKLKAADILSFLEDRRGLLDGVVLSGGEATLYEGIIPFARAVRKMGFAVKLDTNGTRPAIVRQMLDEALLSYIALDYKAPPEKFKAVTGIAEWAAFEETLKLVCRERFVPVEIRTTVHASLLDENDISEIVADLDSRGYHGRYYVQNYRGPSGKTLGNLGPPDRSLSLAALISSAPFPVGLRNFNT
ncbi:MAG: anaerobic ribonucleoside-triphosphate reductase activating protein [Alphaproteobacteria bacterium]|nr:MAG: anaerobic ribonucleoside-triphosphate reductase activating protein [Alphaproteobacteria bacterium]